jgi:hypothetical protein
MIVSMIRHFCRAETYFINTRAETEKDDYFIGAWKIFSHSGRKSISPPATRLLART